MPSALLYHGVTASTAKKMVQNPTQQKRSKAVLAVTPW
jgi:hypothetical protein